MTVLLFWATNTRVKSWVTQRVLHGARGEQGADEHDRRQQPGVGPGRSPRAGRRRARRPARCPRRSPAAATSPTTLHDDAGEAGHEGEPDADGPQVGVEHQQTGPAGVAFTRFGYWARVGAASA